VASKAILMDVNQRHWKVTLCLLT